MRGELPPVTVRPVRKNVLPLRHPSEVAEASPQRQGQVPAAQQADAVNFVTMHSSQGARVFGGDSGGIAGCGDVAGGGCEVGVCGDD